MAIAFVQGTGIQGSGWLVTIAKAFASNVTAGNTLIAMAVGTANAGSFTAGGCTDTLTNTYAMDITRNPASGYGYLAIWSTNTTGGANTITINPEPSDEVMSLVIAEFSGVLAASPLDVSAGAGTTWGTDVHTGNLVCTEADLVCAVMTNIYSTQTLTVDAGYTLIFEAETYTTNTAIPISGMYKILTGSGTDNPGWTVGSNVDWLCIGAAYKPAAGGGLSIPTITETLSFTEALD